MDFTQLAFWLALLLSAFNLWDKIDARISKSKEPTKELENRISSLETIINTTHKQRFESYDRNFDNDLKRIKSMEEGNMVVQQALLALLKHAIDGNEVEALKEASNDLTKYLIKRRTN